MICDTSDIYFPIKTLKEVLPKEVFAFSPTGRPYLRISLTSDFSKFLILSLDHDDCHYPKEEEMDKQVYMLQASVKVTMFKKEKNGSYEKN